MHAYRAERQNKMICFKENTHISCKSSSWIKRIKNAKIDLLFSEWRSACVSMRREARAGDNTGSGVRTSESYRQGHEALAVTGVRGMAMNPDV